MTTAAPTRSPARPASEYLGRGVGIPGGAIPGRRVTAPEHVGLETALLHARALACAEALERDLYDRWRRRIDQLAELPRWVA